MLLSLALAAAAPGIRAVKVQHDSVQEMLRLSAKEGEALQSLNDLRRVTAALREAQAFGSAQRPITLVVAALATVLPAGAAIVALRVDSTGGSLVVMSSSAAAVVAGVEHAPGVVQAEIEGPVTREVLNGTSAERVTVRFRLGTAAARRSRE
jgi:hypothetical protein